MTLLLCTFGLGIVVWKNFDKGLKAGRAYASLLSGTPRVYMLTTFVVLVSPVDRKSDMDSEKPSEGLVKLSSSLPYFAR
jgi:hypothetical protein